MVIQYTDARRDNGRRILKNGVWLDNRSVVPHNRYLLITYGAHLNVEWCNQSRALKYLFKYINKGHDRVTATFYQSSNDDNSEKNIDEVNLYYDCRYISSCEAAWRMFGFEIQYKYPPVERLSFHLPNQQNVIFSDSDKIDSLMDRESINKSMFLAWMETNKKYPKARELTYSEFPEKFFWKSSSREWTPRIQGSAIGLIFFVPPGTGDMYYLRCLLNVVRGPTCYDDLCSINGVQYHSFRDVCYALGFLNDDKECIDRIIEASQWASAQSVRILFATLLSSESRNLLQYQGLILNEDQIKNYALVEVEKILRGCGRSLHEFQSMPFPEDQFFQFSRNRLIHDEMCHDRISLAEEHKRLVSNLNDEQLCVYETIIESANADIGRIFFVYGYGGTGKTFIWKTLSAGLRSKGEIVLNVASSGIASLLLPGGRTAHSRFSIPFHPNEESACNIQQGSPLAELILKSKLIIWDEAPMMHTYCFELLDRSMRDIMKVINSSRADIPFGGKTVELGGDFRQILPVIPKGSRQDIVHATINSSYLWRDCTVLRLTKNMRLQNMGPNESCEELNLFADWIAKIGDGKIREPNDGCASIDIPDDLLIKEFNDPIAAIVQSTYPTFGSNHDDSPFFEERAILAPTIDVVHAVNDYMISINNSEGRLYLSLDSPCHSDRNVNLLNDIHTPEFLNGIKSSEIPNHELNLKVGTPVMLLRNIDHSLGLCNGTRLIITRLGNHVLEGQVLSKGNYVRNVIVPRMSLTPSDPRLPFKFQRRQFPLMVSYAMSIHKSQGQSLSNVRLLLKKPVFSHGQLYVALSRDTNPKGLRILLCESDSDSSSNRTCSTTNVVFKEVFQNL